MSDDDSDYYTERYILDVKRLKKNDQVVSAKCRDIRAPYGRDHNPIGASLTTWDKNTGAKEYEIFTDKYGNRTKKRIYNLKTGKIKSEKNYLDNNVDITNDPEPF